MIGCCVCVVNVCPLLSCIFPHDLVLYIVYTSFVGGIIYHVAKGGFLCLERKQVYKVE
jgi:hypothetical protein